ncbi:hypothetical protein HAX54_007720 [Datura stramonium]|uniref:Uncharacterized protein n=1 Tax=Datura stramonium TaxID=4076 RepID=A0ABS8TD77_DATST|nr:hypothetical protein [Datura stramonium]
MEFSIPFFEELKKEEPFIDLLGEQPKASDSNSHHSISSYRGCSDDTLSAPVTTSATVDIPELYFRYMH